MAKAVRAIEEAEVAEVAEAAESIKAVEVCGSKGSAEVIRGEKRKQEKKRIDKKHKTDSDKRTKKTGRPTMPLIEMRGRIYHRGRKESEF